MSKRTIVGFSLLPLLLGACGSVGPTDNNSANLVTSTPSNPPPWHTISLSPGKFSDTVKSKDGVSTEYTIDADSKGCSLMSRHIEVNKGMRRELRTEVISQGGKSVFNLSTWEYLKERATTIYSVRMKYDPATSATVDGLGIQPTEASNSLLSQLQNDVQYMLSQCAAVRAGAMPSPPLEEFRNLVKNLLDYAPMQSDIPSVPDLSKRGLLEHHWKWAKVL